MNEEEIKNAVTFIKEFKQSVELLIKESDQLKHVQLDLHVEEWKERQAIDARSTAIDFSVKSVPSGSSTTDEIVARAEKFANFILKENKND